MDRATTVGNLLAKASNNAGGLALTNQEMGDDASAFDVWTHSYEGLSDSMRNFADDPIGTIQSYDRDLSAAIKTGLTGDWQSSSFAAVGDSVTAQAKGLGDMVGDIGDAEGTLATVGATFRLLTGVEQMLSTLVSVIPFPALPAIRVMDIGIGLPHGHSHPPNLVPPAPMIPLPSIGPIIPIPILSGAVRTLINGRPAARCGDMGLAIWCGGYFPMYEVFLGSSSVWIEGARAGRIAVDITKHCIFSSPKPQDLPIGPPIGITIMASDNVLIGGVPMPSLLSLALGAAMRGMLKGLGKVARGLKGSKIMQALSVRVQAAARKAMNKLGVPPSVQNKVQRAICSATGHPVDVATGKVFTEALDFSLAGLVPIRFERVWFSTSEYQGPLGNGWHHSYDMALLEDPVTVVVRLADGRGLVFPTLAIGESMFNRQERLTLRRTSDGYVLEDTDLRYEFYGINGDGIRPLTRVADESDNAVDLDYDSLGRLKSIRNNSGRYLQVQYDDRSRISGLWTVNPDVPGAATQVLAYEYDGAGNLTAVRDRLGRTRRYEYSGRLLVRDTDRNGNSFYFTYDGTGSDARCVHTWGDGGFFERRLSYDSVLQQTTVTNTVGETVVYDWNDVGIVTRVVDPAGLSYEFEWDDDANLLADIDPAGATTRYEYDDRCNLISVTDAMGRVTKLSYDDRGHPISISQPGRSDRVYTYDDKGLVRSIGTRVGPATRVEWDFHGRLLRLQFPDGSYELYSYDSSHNLVRKRERSGQIWVFAHTGWGAIRRARCIGGRHTDFEYDDFGRLIQTRYPDGATRTYTYDAEDNIIAIRDGDGGVRRFAYSTTGKLIGRFDSLGRGVQFVLDGEARIRSVRNGKGEAYRFDYDGAGRVADTVGFDGVRRSYTYAAGIDPVAVEETGVDGVPSTITRTFLLQRNIVGRIIRKRLSSSAEHTFEYDAADRLVRADAPGSRLAFEYDGLGHIVKTEQAGRRTRYAYLPDGRLASRVSPLGNRVSYGYDEEGRLNRIEARRADGLEAWLEIRYGENGRIAEQATSGGAVTRFVYDDNGRLVQSLRRSRDGDERVQYHYRPGGELLRIERSGWGATQLETDASGQLTVVKRADTVVRYITDKSGNPVEAGEHRLEVARGDRLSHRDGLPYEYDAYGNTTRRPFTEQRLQYNEFNELTRVSLPAGDVVAEYEYDALGRRSRKTAPTGATEFLWDGEQLLAEIGTNRSVEYVSIDFRPFLQISDDGICFFNTDPRGVPEQLTDHFGRTVWHGGCDEYGRSLARDGDHHQPFRLLGQYADEESRLYYSLFRYYDPEDGRFVSQDPIRLAGGVNLYSYSPNPYQEADPWGLYDEIQMDTTYGEDPLSKEAVKHRVEKGLSPGKNVSVIEYVEHENGPKKYVSAHSNGPHAERLAWNELPEHVRNDPGKVKVVYTEFEPCDYHKCGQHLESRLKYDGPVYYHHKYNPKGPVRTEGVKQHKKDIKAAMEALANCAK